MKKNATKYIKYHLPCQRIQRMYVNKIIIVNHVFLVCQFKEAFMVKHIVYQICFDVQARDFLCSTYHQKA